MKKPNFIYIGPPKTASKWITKVLQTHPEIYVSGIDMYYFDRDDNYKKGSRWYLNFFRDATNKHKAVGELSHDYIYSSDAAKRIYDFDPDMKIIINLRNPVDLSFSVYKAMVKYGETSSSFRDAMLKNEMTIGIKLMDYGKYYDNVNEYIKYFNKNNILFLNYDNLVNNKQLFMKQIYNFLDVEDFPKLSNIPKYNTAKESRFKLLGVLAKSGANFLRTINLLSLLRVLKNSALLKKILFKKRALNEVHHEDKLYFSKYYLNDLKKTEKIVNLDLSNWYKI